LLSVINLPLAHHFQKRLEPLMTRTEDSTADLVLLASVLRILEESDFESTRLRQLRDSLMLHGIQASAAIKRLERIVRYLEQRRNPLIRVLNSFLFYAVLCTLKTESWRRNYGSLLGVWLAAVGEIETLTALSCYAYEHPSHVWPQFCEKTPWFEAENLAHPLLPDGQAVENDVKLGEELRLMLLSGPNMSGKSTFMRGIGLNVVLAQCGAPVRAKRLLLSRLAVGASICVLDSLQGGVSRFYAEIKRLKRIADMTEGSVPVLFLLDELLSGTNSEDRRKGAEMLVQQLIRHGALGLVTTHDLALTRIPENMQEAAKNFHFEDHLENGMLQFDFKLKEGIVQSSNALRLMQSIGLF
jgi:DNA mismatch repair ATPase MutS